MALQQPMQVLLKATLVATESRVAQPLPALLKAIIAVYMLNFVFWNMSFWQTINHCKGTHNFGSHV